MKKVLGFFVAAAFVASLSTPAMAADGGKIFKSKCSSCHGKDAGGTAMGPSLKGNDFVKGDAAAVKATILNGRKGKDKKYKKFPIAMPAHKGKISDADADAIVSYLKGL